MRELSFLDGVAYPFNTVSEVACGSFTVFHLQRCGMGLDFGHNSARAR